MRIIKFIARYIVQIAILVGPLISLKYSILDYLGLKFQEPEKSRLELIIRLGLSGIILLSYILYDIVQVYFPFKKQCETQNKFLAWVLDIWKQDLENEYENASEECRINIMFIKRLTLLPFLKQFRYVARLYFKEKDPDRNISFFSGQGLVGQVRKSCKPQFVDLRNWDFRKMNFREKYLWGNKYRLSYRQLVKTSHLKAIVSVPCILLLGSPPNEIICTVGIINIDARTSAGADMILNSENFRNLTESMMTQGKAIAFFA